MDKRLAKRHKRQVARAKERVRLSEPDVRTPEQIEAAREKSRPDFSLGPAFARSSKPNPAVAPEDAPKTED
jgi:hypothetical protein